MYKNVQKLQNTILPDLTYKIFFQHVLVVFFSHHSILQLLLPIFLVLFLL